jgi:hypothetical protein
MASRRKWSGGSREQCSHLSMISFTFQSISSSIGPGPVGNIVAVKLLSKWPMNYYDAISTLFEYLKTAQFPLRQSP